MSTSSCWACVRPAHALSTRYAASPPQSSMAVATRSPYEYSHQTGSLDDMDFGKASTLNNGSYHYGEFGNFVPSAEFNKALAMYESPSFNGGEPCYDGKDGSLPIIGGPIGVGKTRTGRELCLALVRRLGGGVALELDLPAFSDMFAAMKTSSDPATMGAALFFAMFSRTASRPKFTFSDILGRITRHFQCEVIVLHLARFHFDLLATQKILRACQYERAEGDGANIIPVVSGLLPVETWRALPPNVLSITAISLQPFKVCPEEPDAFELEFARLACVPLALYKRAAALRMVYADTGGLPGLVRELLGTVHCMGAKAARLREGAVDAADASLLLADTVGRVSSTWAYCGSRWEAVARQGALGMAGVVVEANMRQSAWVFSTATVLCRVLLCIVADRVVDAETQVLAGVVAPANEYRSRATYSDCVAGGMVRFANDAKTLLTAPILAVLAMDALCAERVLPALFVAGAADRYRSAAHSLVQTACTSLLLRVLAAAEFKEAVLDVRALRPDAHGHSRWQFGSAMAGVRVKTPSKDALHACSLVAPLGGDLMGCVADALTAGRLLVCARGGAVDVLGRFDGERAVADGGVEAVVVVTLTRVSLHQSDVASIVADMRRVAVDVAGVLTAQGAKPVVVVTLFDVFIAGGLADAAATEPIVLGANEAMAVTTTAPGDLDAAVGSLFAAHQRMHTARAP